MTVRSPTVTSTFVAVRPHRDDGDGGTSNIVTEDINFTLVTDPPVAVDDAFSVDEDSVLNTAPADWWNANWQNRLQLTFATPPTSPLTDVPVLVKLDATRIDYSQVQDAGQDLRFIDADGSTVLAYEIEEWNEGGTSYVWVKVPQIDTSGTDFITLYYGNESAPDAQSAGAVWSSGYEGVWHLKDDFANSTNRPYGDATNAGTADAAGQLADGQSFSGVSDHLDLGQTAIIDGTTPFTVSAWVYVDQVTGTSDQMTIYSRYDAAGSAGSFG